MNIGCTVLLISDTVFSVGKKLEFLKDVGMSLVLSLPVIFHNYFFINFAIGQV